MGEANHRAAEQHCQRQNALELDEYLKSSDSVRPSAFDNPFNYPQQRREVCSDGDHLLSSVSDACSIHSPSLFTIHPTSTHIISSPNCVRTGGMCTSHLLYHQDRRLTCICSHPYHVSNPLTRNPISPLRQQGWSKAVAIVAIVTISGWQSVNMLEESME